MKKCNHCNVSYNTDRFTCPLCKNLLEETNEVEVKTVYQPYPKFKDKIYKINLLQRSFFFLSLIAILVVVVINYYEYRSGNKNLWSVITLASILTAWSFIKGIIISKKNGAKRVFNFGLSLVLLILSIEYCIIGNYTNWSINYVIPFIMIGTLTAINLIVLFKKKSYSSYIGYQFWTSILLILNHLLYIFKVTTIAWPSLTCLLYGIVTIVGIFFLGGKATKEEFKKRFTL